MATLSLLRSLKSGPQTVRLIGWQRLTASVAKTFDATRRIDVIPDESFTYTASCVDNEALVSVYVHDHSFGTADDPSVPAYCGDVDVEGNKVAYNFTLPCDCSTPPSTILMPRRALRQHPSAITLMSRSTTKI